MTTKLINNFLMINFVGFQNYEAIKRLVNGDNENYMILRDYVCNPFILLLLAVIVLCVLLHCYVIAFLHPRNF